MAETLERSPVPGGSAVFRQRAEMTPRQTRELEIGYTAAASPSAAAVSGAKPTAGTTIINNVNAQTNANPQQIANEIGWKLMAMA